MISETVPAGIHAGAVAEESLGSLLIGYFWARKELYRDRHRRVIVLTSRMVRPKPKRIVEKIEEYED